MPTPKMTDEQATALLKTRGERPIKFRHLPGVMDAVADIIRQYTDAALAPLSKRLDALERENAELKAAGTTTLADAYQGIWAPGRNYKRGDVSTHDGSVWLAQVDTNTKPGSDAAWRMLVKRGRDGKDAR